MTGTAAHPETSGHSGTANWWRSLDQLEGNAAFQEVLHREFAEGVSEAPDEV